MDGITPTMEIGGGGLGGAGGFGGIIGLLRYPNQWTYTAGQFPPIFGGCCGGNNI